ncbi:Rieske (2Fe-2S) protein [Pseudomonas sp. Marseille-P9899]|uniref:Rieske (2Fe-2S) protein n=1 Tax=Pseudomonas sp. Marseille-P9899 TaxID=2730401 RepID=UPI00158CB23C|nr:Rieske (2Fe-2S) protein [Pseudomonas sp. Marseille-P9899]
MATFLCHREQLLEGQARGFDPWQQGRDTVIGLLWQGEVKAYRNLCPHLDVAMQYRKDRFMSGDGRHIVCFAHGALFDPADGVCLLGPCLGQALQALVVKTDDDLKLWVHA